jgi:hypothetical protein
VTGKAQEVAWIVAEGIQKLSRIKVEGEAGGVCGLPIPSP